LFQIDTLVSTTNTAWFAPDRYSGFHLYLSGTNQAVLVVETGVSIWNKPSCISGGNQSIYLEQTKLY
jgi:hypothetical protein